MRSAARGGRVGSAFRTGRRSSRLRLQSRSIRSGSTRSKRPAAASVSSSIAVLDDQPAALLLALGGTATMDAGVGFLELVSDLRSRPGSPAT